MSKEQYLYILTQTAVFLLCISEYYGVPMLVKTSPICESAFIICLPAVFNASLSSLTFIF